MKAYINWPGPPYRTEELEVRTKGDPKLRLLRSGYTKQAGSPSPFQVKRRDEKRWRRVYFWQFSNNHTNFIVVDGKNVIVLLMAEK